MTSMSYKILLVEDNRIAQKTCKLMLESHGLLVELAESGAEAIELSKINSYDLVLMDIGLGDTDGYAVATEMRKMSNHAKTPIVALTAHSFAEVNPKASACKMNYTLEKPLTNEKLNQVIKKFLTA